MTHQSLKPVRQRHNRFVLPICAMFALSLGAFCWVAVFRLSGMRATPWRRLSRLSR